MIRENIHRNYRVKGIAGVETYLQLIGENGEGYDIRITSIGPTSVKESQEFISHNLFDACVRTGYLTECAEPAVAQIA